jgi:Carboxypeptidase regulatory-like domain
MVSSDQFAGQTLGRRPLLLVFLGLMLVPPISNLSIAQTTTSGGLAGVVADSSNAVVPDADVEIKDNAKSTHQSTQTDREGVYRFFFLAPARYTLTVSHGGFQTENRAVNVLLGPPVSVNVSLQVAKSTTAVTVTAEAPLIQAENGDVSATMNQKQISEVPNPGNDLTYIVQTAPGVVMNTDVQAESRQASGRHAVAFGIAGLVERRVSRVQQFLDLGPPLSGLGTSVCGDRPSHSTTKSRRGDGSG